jgi:hypothetical protein
MIRVGDPVASRVPMTPSELKQRTKSARRLDEADQLTRIFVASINTARRGRRPGKNQEPPGKNQEPEEDH